MSAGADRLAAALEGELRIDDAEVSALVDLAAEVEAALLRLRPEPAVLAAIGARVREAMARRRAPWQRLLSGRPLAVTGGAVAAAAAALAVGAILTRARRAPHLAPA